MDKAICCLNYHLLATFHFSPKELLLGLVVNTIRTPLVDSTSALRTADVAIQISYVVQQNLNSYTAAVNHTLKHKHAFDRHVLASRAGEHIFTRGNLVQVQNSALELTLCTSKKILPQWSEPQYVVEWLVNSYQLATLEGTAINGLFSARRLRLFTPTPGSHLAQDQATFLSHPTGANTKQPSMEITETSHHASAPDPHIITATTLLHHTDPSTADRVTGLEAQ